MLTGVLASQMQTLTLKGSVNFNIADKSLYVKDVRLREDMNSQPHSLKESGDFIPGFINTSFSMNLGTLDNGYGSFALYFDIINATDIKWAISSVALSEQLQADGVTEKHSGMIEVNELTDTDSDGYKNFDPSTTAIDGTLILTITAPNSSSIDLSGITITLEEYVPPYERVNQNGEPDPDGGYILLGYYPQTVKTSDVTIINETQPEANGYYKGSDGEYYERVVANPYETNYTFSDGTSITSGQTYYFKVEPLLWRILTENYNGTGNALVVSNMIIDATLYQSNYIQSGDYYYATDEDGTILIDESATVGEGVDENHQVYANNYKHSELRAFLTGEFYDKAFGEEEKLIIQLTEVDNSLESTRDSGGQYICENTNDYVFALSSSNVFNTGYGYKNNEGDPNRVAITSDYSRAKHVTTETSTIYYPGAGRYWLRSPEAYFYDSCGAIRVDTGDTGYNYVYNDRTGIVPALQIQL